MRRWIFNLHLYLGLAIGLLVSVVGITGSLLVFSHEIDARLDPHLLHAPPGDHELEPASVDAFLAKILEAHPDQSLHYFMPPRKPGDVYEIRLKPSNLRVYVAPGSGEILGSRYPERRPIGFLFALHTKFLAGEQGKQAVGVIGILLIVLGATGIYLWWPRGGGFRRALTVYRSGNWKRTNYDLHRVGGFFTSGLLILISFTGVAIVFGEWFTDWTYRLTNTPPRPKLTVTAGANAVPLPWDSLLRTAKAELPDAIVTRVTPPAKAGAPVVIRKRFPQELHPNGMCNVFLNPYTGEVLRVENALEASLGPRLLNLRYPVHIGQFGGLGVRLLWVALGLTPALLFVTGSLMWWNRTRKKRRKPAPAHV